MHHELVVPKYSLCIRQAAQLLPPLSFLSLLASEMPTAEEAKSLKETALYTGLKKIDFSPPEQVTVGGHQFELFVENKTIQIGTDTLTIPQESRYWYAQSELGKINGNYHYYVFERFDMTREPSQSDGIFFTFSHLSYNPTDHSTHSRRVEATSAGVVQSFRYKHHYGDFFDTFQVGTEDAIRTVSIGRYFNRAKQPPYTFVKENDLHILQPENNGELVVTANGISASEMEEVTFEVTREGSLFYQDGEQPSTVSIKNGVVQVFSGEQLWQVPLNQTSFQQTAGEKNISSPLEMLEHMFEAFRLNAHPANVVFNATMF